MGSAITICKHYFPQLTVHAFFHLYIVHTFV